MPAEHFEHAIAVAVQLFCAPAFGDCSALGAQHPGHVRGEAKRKQKLKGLQEMFRRPMEGAQEDDCANHDEALGENERPKDPITQKRRQVTLTGEPHESETNERVTDTKPDSCELYRQVDEKFY